MRSSRARNDNSTTPLHNSSPVLDHRISGCEGVAAPRSFLTAASPCTSRVTASAARSHLRSKAARRRRRPGRTRVARRGRQHHRHADDLDVDRRADSRRAGRARGLVLHGTRAEARRGDPCRGGVDHRVDHAPPRARARHRRRGRPPRAHDERDARPARGVLATPAAVRVRRVARAAQPARLDPHQSRGRAAQHRHAPTGRRSRPGCSPRTSAWRTP